MDLANLTLVLTIMLMRYEAFFRILERHGIRISMDGTESYSYNLFIERLWRTVKYEEVYLKAYQDGRDAKISLGESIRFYNTERPHQALGHQTPAEVQLNESRNK